MRFVFTDQAGFIRNIEGIFLVRTINLTGSQTDFSEFDLQLEGTSNIDIGVVIPPGGGGGDDDSDSGAPACLDELYSDYWEAVEGESSVSGLGVQGLTFADQQVLFVSREGIEHEFVASGPGNREYTYDGTEISFDPTNPFNAEGERIFVIWKAPE